MPLTVRTNGSAGSNIISASWFNDFLNLLTGQMQDQEVTIQNVLVLKSIGGLPATGPTLALAAGTNLGVGLYTYGYSFANADGESKLSPTTNITTTSGNQAVNLSNVLVGPTGTTRRRIYRSPVGGATPLKFVADIADNTTTTFSDTTTDGNLGPANQGAVSTFGGAVIIRDQNNLIQGVYATDTAQNLIINSYGSNIGFQHGNGVQDMHTGPGLWMDNGAINVNASGIQSVNSSTNLNLRSLSPNIAFFDSNTTQEFHTGPGIWLDNGAINFRVGALARIAFGFAASVSSTGTTITHSLGSATVITFCTSTASGTAVPCSIANVTSTQMTLYVNQTTAIGVWWLALASS